ncbi:probable ADP-ribosylation factor GTPase-activating protein AGD14 isoform X1 [Selaginella moellendorffii]|uniref:probable ADP-ribosylation factor GTPase-activating protein AGD14 isoform X1 n=1 Tax=Selaginella moellendorffii TaxID=88036 RepID=UPI000D1C979B|nr:probable ADP-ribosylation factor GTPase-activating protein AGD14 isoform X1 [Selaginella moellendorffii]XP_024536872.1 probable ADP-ribosylation factor GTPase-activating protein AGD14 isoform X1 [Selaginella moellendorffii]XP_024536873.1 probable ADP-ribosylation factor GTPase-activating protein AGD14 isoform X1 [Selaginella moellendorffii]XP_024536874.1 probable ADP-ribosylation factor GTPase-activating protein AGD14 isoform X1 [Selaginella moellendorffii]|eukprot:XP_024536871.1 probable ADP-ribosylation factor GTPase-activating protein AGD14 isoform X1 [Selaginella moellendorffii]
MAPSKEDERHEKIIRGLLKLPGNRRCVNCGSLGPQYVCTSFSTFICTLCSGIHREFLHRIKSISMAKFTAGEISELQAGGNDQARQVFLKAWNSDRNIFPDSSNPDKIREFIKLVYVQRRFTGEKQPSRSPMHETPEYREARPSPRTSYGGLAYGNRDFVRTIPGRRENGGATVEDNGEDDVKSSPQSPPNQKTASGSKRETVIRQFLQPPVEKRKDQQLQRNYSSGSIVPDQTSPAARPPQVQRSNSLSLKDLMTDEKTSHRPDNPKTPPRSATKSRSLIDLNTDQQQKVPHSRSSPVTTKSSSTPCLVDLISGDASNHESVASTKFRHDTDGSRDLIDLISSPEGDSSQPTQVDPFVTTSFAGLDLAADPFARSGPVQAQTGTNFTSFSAPGPANLPQSIPSEVSQGVLPGAPPQYPSSFPGISPNFTMPPSVGFLPAAPSPSISSSGGFLSNSALMTFQQFDPAAMNVGVQGAVHHVNTFGPPSNQSLGYFGVSTSVNPFDHSQSQYAPLGTTHVQVPPNFYHPNYHWEATQVTIVPAAPSNNNNTIIVLVRQSIRIRRHQIIPKKNIKTHIKPQRKVFNMGRRARLLVVGLLLPICYKKTKKNP